MSIIDLGKEHLWRTILLLKYLILTRTNEFVKESNKGPVKDRVFYLISICFLLVAIVTAFEANLVPTNLIFSDPTMPEQFMGGPIVGIIPILITAAFSFIVSRRLNIFALVNLHFMISLMMCVFIFSTFLLPLTSRTIHADYELMKAGQGQGTEAFGMTCGNLERKAEQLFIQNKTFIVQPMTTPLGQLYT